jgi:hypothetical protein
VNHVNLFDPFVLYCTVPQFIRGLELESHFKIPAYGWMMKRFGNVPVPATHRPADLKRMWRLTQEAIDSGISLSGLSRRPAHAHGPRRSVQERRLPAWLCRPARRSSRSAWSDRLNSTTNWDGACGSGPIVVYLHDTIETANLDKEKDLGALRDSVREIVARPIDEYYS